MSVVPFASIHPPGTPPQLFARSRSASAPQQASILPAPNEITTSVGMAATSSASRPRSTMRQGTVTNPAISSDETPSIGSSRAG